MRKHAQSSWYVASAGVTCCWRYALNRPTSGRRAGGDGDSDKGEPTADSSAMACLSKLILMGGEMCGGVVSQEDAAATEKLCRPKGLRARWVPAGRNTSIRLRDRGSSSVLKRGSELDLSTFSWPSE